MNAFTKFVDKLSESFNKLFKSSAKSNVTKKYIDSEIWLVLGGKEYHHSDDSKCLFIRVLHRGNWYMCNQHGHPIGKPQIVSDKWTLLKRIS